MPKNEKREKPEIDARDETGPRGDQKTHEASSTLETSRQKKEEIKGGVIDKGRRQTR